MLKVASYFMNIETNKMTQVVREKDEWNSVSMHLFHISVENSKIFETLQNYLLCNNMSIYKADTRFHHTDWGFASFVDYVIDIPLLLSEFSICWETSGDIWTIVVDHVLLIHDDGLPILNNFVIPMVR